MVYAWRSTGWKFLSFEVCKYTLWVQSLSKIVYDFGNLVYYNIQQHVGRKLMCFFHGKWHGINLRNYSHYLCYTIITTEFSITASFQFIKLVFQYSPSNFITEMTQNRFDKCLLFPLDLFHSSQLPLCQRPKRQFTRSHFTNTIIISFIAFPIEIYQLPSLNIDTRCRQHGLLFRRHMGIGKRKFHGVRGLVSKVSVSSST